MLIVGVRVQYGVLVALQLRLRRALYVIKEAIIWCRATLACVLSVRVAGVCERAMEVGSLVPIVMALALGGDGGHGDYE